jgi:hypothetical protein
MHKDNDSRLWPMAKRKDGRIRRAGTVAYRHGLSQKGSGRWLDRSGSGARLHLGRYFRPGTLFTLMLDPITETEIQSVVVWCIPADKECEFEAGVRFLHDGPESKHIAATAGLSSHELRRDQRATAASA